jgi:hypothetical protein
MLRAVFCEIQSDARRDGGAPGVVARPQRTQARHLRFPPAPPLVARLGSEERPGYGLRRDDPLRKFVGVNSGCPRTAGHGPRPKKLWALPTTIWGQVLGTTDGCLRAARW